MKKLCIFLITLILAVGCTMTSSKARDAVSDYLDNYKRLDDKVVASLDSLVSELNYNDDNSNTYKEIMKKQYSDLDYEIVNEEYNGDEAIVTTKISVYDLYKVQKDAEEYKTNNKEEFYNDNNTYDANLFLAYKLKQMKSTTTRVEYTIDFKVIKKDGKWTMDDISTETLEKIHGIYNYEND